VPLRFQPSTFVTNVPALPTIDRPGSTMSVSDGHLAAASRNEFVTASMSSAGDGTDIWHFNNDSLHKKIFV
jgi:hypothetical protein